MVTQLWDASTRKNSKELRVDFYHETSSFSFRNICYVSYHLWSTLGDINLNLLDAWR